MNTISDRRIDLLVDLFVTWYGISTPSLRAVTRISETAFSDLWINVWFVKGEIQHRIDAYLKKYAPLFEGTLIVPEDLKWDYKILLIMGQLLAYDQISRNIYRNSALAYATDQKARVLVETVMPFWDRLPLPIKVSCILVYIHSEDIEDVAKVEALLEDIRIPMKLYEPVWFALTGIAKNHRERMRLFGRIPERNRFLGRTSTLMELSYLSAAGAS